MAETAFTTRSILIVNRVFEFSGEVISLIFSRRASQICGPKHLKLLLPNVNGISCMDYKIISSSV